jgi:hypothetical protein
MKNYLKFEPFSLKENQNINEKWIQNKIIEDPSILGLGEVIVKDSEKIQISGGRLDLLLYNLEENIRYETEIQLGKTDESHIIRTIEYWDIERKRNPQYEHVAVIIAEDITSRFLNVISLFNGTIPLIAIQMKGVKIGESFSIIFTKVIDILEYEIEVDEEPQEPTDRKFWEKKSSKDMINLCDKFLLQINELYPIFELNYTKNYIGLSKNGISKNFIEMTPKKNHIVVSFKHQIDPEFDRILDENSFDILKYDKQFRQYKVRLNNSDFSDRNNALNKLIKLSYDKYKF